MTKLHNFIDKIAKSYRPKLLYLRRIFSFKNHDRKGVWLRELGRFSRIKRFFIAQFMLELTIFQ